MTDLQSPSLIQVIISLVLFVLLFVFLLGRIYKTLGVPSPFARLLWSMGWRVVSWLERRDQEQALRPAPEEFDFWYKACIAGALGVFCAIFLIVIFFSGDSPYWLRSELPISVLTIFALCLEIQDLRANRGQTCGYVFRDHPEIFSTGAMLTLSSYFACTSYAELQRLYDAVPVGVEEGADNFKDALEKGSSARTEILAVQFPWLAQFKPGTITESNWRRVTLAVCLRHGFLHEVKTERQLS